MTGNQGEQAVAQLLREYGYHVLACNYHSRYGELDIIARDDKYIVFVEVKTRSVARKAAPQEAVTPAKQKRLLQTALHYLQERPALAQLQPRFDVAAVIADGALVKEISYFTDSFGWDWEIGVDWEKGESF